MFFYKIYILLLLTENYNFLKKNLTLDLRNGSVYKMLACEHENLDSIPRSQIFKKSVWSGMHCL